MSRTLLVALALAVVAALVGLAVLVTGSGPEVATPAAGPEAREVQEPSDTPAPRAPRRVASRTPATPPAVADSDGNVDEDAPSTRTVDDQGRLAADHRGKGPPRPRQSKISGRAGAALRMGLRPEVDACVEALSDPEALAGASFSVTVDVSARDGRYVVGSPAVASRDLTEKPFFACIEERLDGFSVDAPDEQENADSQRLTFPYRVP